VFRNIEAAIQARPECTLGIQNYHYETRTEHYRDKDGNTQTRTKRVRVNTHRATEEYRFSDWVDRSPPSSGLRYIDNFLLTRLYTFKYVLLSPRAAANYHA